ncbi:MAG: hypothetical protein KDC54_01760, partial [Lewinella sp.]|nr:hypothetical protein [Lewinella sp.]
MEQPGGDTARYFVLQAVRDYCGGAYDCLLPTYRHLQDALNQDARHLLSLVVVQEIARITEEQRDIGAQAQAYDDLSRLYGRLADGEKESETRDRALALYEQAGNHQRVLEMRAHWAESPAWHLGEVRETLPVLEAYRQQAMDLGYTQTAYRIRVRIKYICEAFGLEDELVEQIEALEQVPFSDPLQPAEYEFAFQAAAGRGDLLKAEGRYQEAERFYQKALRIMQTAEEAHYDYFLEIYALRRLANLEWARRDTNRTQFYLDQLYLIADKFGVHHEVIQNLSLQRDIALGREDYASAYHFLEDINRRTAILDSLNGAYDVQKDMLSRARSQLEAEKAQQALELQLSQNRLRSTLIIIALITLLVAGLLLGIYGLRSDKRKLAARNALIRRQAEQLKALDAAKSRFFANVSHELRTPLALLLGPVRTLLKRGNQPAEAVELLQVALRSGQQLQRLVNEILDLRKLETGHMSLQPTPTVLSTFFQQYAAQFETLALDKQIDFSCETDVDPALVADIDREKCRQVLHNLLSNAFKFTPPGGRIVSRLHRQEDLLTIEVADTGAGIHPDDLPRVFDRYFQTSRPDAPAQGGTGIGLALCQEYLKLFGGRMEVDSRPDQGAVFRAVFPLILSDQPDTAAAVTAGKAT